MTTPTKCSKPKGQYCRIHNPAPTNVSVGQQVEDSKKKIANLLKPKFNADQEMDVLNDKLQAKIRGSISIDHVPSTSKTHDVYYVAFSAEHDLNLCVAYPKDGGEPIRAIDYGFTDSKDYSGGNLSFDGAFSESNLSYYAGENPFYPSDLNVLDVQNDRYVRDYYEKKHGISIYTPPVYGNVSVDYDAIDEINDKHEIERAEIAVLVSDFFKKLDDSKGVR